jgi:chromosome partitioning protein
MAIVITVAQQKGGTGKTTLAANLAAALGREQRVALLDIDPQRSLTRWHALRSERNTQPSKLTFSDVSGWRLSAELDRLKRSHDVVLVDTPPQIDTDARLAIRGASIVLVPVQPSPPDVWAAEGTLKLASDENRPAAIVLNRVPPTSRLRDTISDQLGKRKLPLMQTSLGNRTGFAAAFAEGLGVTEAAPRSTAATELTAVIEELLGMVR